LSGGEAKLEQTPAETVNAYRRELAEPLGFCRPPFPRVQIKKLGELLLVSYRHVYVREIDRRQGCTRALVRPRAVGKALRSPCGLPPSLPNREPKPSEKV